MMNTLIGRLYLLSILVVVPFYFFIYLSFDYSREIVKDELLNVARLISNQSVKNQENLVEETQNFLQSLASMSQVQTPDSPYCRQFVSDITPLFDRYVNIGVPNEKGILTCNGTQLISPVDVNDRVYINEALTQHRFTTSGLHFDRVIGAPTINFAYPIKSRSAPNDVVGVTVAVVSLDWWSALLDNSDLPESSVAYVLDREGNAVASFPQHIQYEEPSDFDSIWLSRDGVNRVFSQNQVTDLNGHVLLTFVTGVAVDKPLSRVNQRYTFVVILFSTLVLILLMLIRSFFVDAIAKPLSKLSTLAQKLGRNERINLVKSTGVKEMDALQNNFIEMAEHKFQAEQKVVLQAQTDSLTGISNRDAFNRALGNTFQSHQGKKQVAIILIGLDNFKDLNDTRGHEAGDEVLKEIALRLKHNISTARLLSRLGDDEFVFILEGDNASESRALGLCEKVIELVKQPISLEHGDTVITTSIGVSLYPNEGEDVRSIMSAADQAMYHAKQNGRDTVRRFSQQLKDTLHEKMELLKDLRNGINNQEFYLLYQPILNKHKEVIKFEALIRWQHPEKGLIPPHLFIPFAEESGQIIEIGRWVIQEAKQASELVREVYGENVQISVNVSPIQLSKQQGAKGQLLEELLTQKVGKNGVERQNGLIVEITENLLMNSDESTRNTLLAFREKGIQVALDDFGTGYSSLAYIMNYDIDYLKIDRSFVQQLGEESASKTLCEAIISMAHALGVAVIAEGVETQVQADFLLESGCDYLQGFYFSKPIPLDQVLIYQQDKSV